MDYLYDKVDLYDGLKEIMQGKASTAIIHDIQSKMQDIEHHMLHFLDNHDEQRIASPEFAGNPDKARPAMLVSALISSSPTMLYFGQEVGEAGAENAGFGQPSRTSIFDYIGVPQHQKWMNSGKFDGGLLNENETALRHFYKRVMNFTLEHSSLTGEYVDLFANGELSDASHAFLRYDASELIIATSRFAAQGNESIKVTIPAEHISAMNLADGTYSLEEKIEGLETQSLTVDNGIGYFSCELQPLAALAWVLKLK